jgi:NADH-quinone oxidoreductase subunit M
MGELGVSFAVKLVNALVWFSNPLTQMLIWPLIGSIAVAMTPRTNLRRIRALAVTFTVIPFLVSVLLLSGLPESVRSVAPFSNFPGASDQLREWQPWAQFQAFTPRGGMQYGVASQAYPWFAMRFGEAQSLTINWNVGADGISMPLIVLAGSIMLLCCLWGMRRTERLREYFALFLLLECGLLGIFVALDYVLFYLFWELMLIPMYFLISGWGKRRERAERAAIKFFIYTVTGSVFYLIAFIAMQIYSNRLDFSIMDVNGVYLSGAMDYIPFAVKAMLFAGLMLAFAVKIPMFPFHTWLPDAHTEAPTEMSVILAAVMLKTGAYGMIRIVYTALPDVAYQLGPVVATCGVIAIVYGAAITVVQTDIKRMVAYSSISHMGFVVLGISSLNYNGLVGSVFHMVGHGIIIATLFFLCGVIEERYGTRDLRELSGFMRLAPAYGGALAIAGFAAMGFPLMMGFWGELLVLQGAFFNNPNWTQIRLWTGNGSSFLQWCAAFAVIGILTSAVYIINMLTKVLTGEYTLPVLVPAMATANIAAGSLPAYNAENEADDTGAFARPGGLSPPAGETERSEAELGSLLDVETTLVPPMDAQGHTLQPWKGMDPLHAMALVPLLAAMLLFFWWPAPIINAVQAPASALYAIWLGR